tara:strand:- start:9 stop:293 length:285 start_codon:yes stop_codon:yes gene_type:complete
MLPALTHEDLIVTWSTSKIRENDLIVFDSEDGQKLVKIVSKIEGSQITVAGTNPLLGSTLTSKPVSGKAIIGKVVLILRTQRVTRKFFASLGFH